MASPRKTLWTRFFGMATKLHKPHPLILFIDRNCGGKAFGSCLRSHGVDFVLHDDVFSKNKGDHEWLPEIARRGWVAVTGDIETTRSVPFLRELTASTGTVFVIRALNGATAENKADIIANALHAIRRVIERHPPPFICRIGKGGELNITCRSELNTILINYHKKQ